jgi:glycosyltransferase involved in cell wall biosynthesis
MARRGAPNLGGLYTVGAGMSVCTIPLSGETILCLATQAWDAHWTPVQQVMSRLAPHSTVLYVEPFRPLVRRLANRANATAGPRSSKLPRLREVMPRLFVYRPNYPYFPFHLKSPFLAAANAPLYKAEISALLRKFGSKRPWLWAFFAQCLSVLDLKFEHVIYDCVDDWPAFFPDAREKKVVTAIDNTLSRAAEMVFVGSDPLKVKKSPLNPKTFVVNHAADIRHFSKAADPQTSVPADLEKIPHPRIGFVGMVDLVRFDSELIRLVATNPEYHVVIVGGAMPGAEKSLLDLPNVHLLGMKPLVELPGYLKGMDVCLMPYRLNDATRSIYPLKLHEYMATGKPVVATAIPAVDNFRDLIYVAENENQFVEQITRALIEKDPEVVLRRRACAGEHSWEAHVAEKLRLVQVHLK